MATQRQARFLERAHGKQRGDDAVLVVLGAASVQTLANLRDGERVQSCAVLQHPFIRIHRHHVGMGVHADQFAHRLAQGDLVHAVVHVAKVESEQRDQPFQRGGEAQKFRVLVLRQTFHIEGGNRHEFAQHEQRCLALLVADLLRQRTDIQRVAHLVQCRSGHGLACGNERVIRRLCLQHGREEAHTAVALYPAHPPASVLVAIEHGQPRLAANALLRRVFLQHQFLHHVHAALRERQLVAVEPLQKLHLLQRRDAQRAGEPELVDAAGDVTIAIAYGVDVLLHALRADLPHQCLEVRHCREAEAFQQAQIPVQFRAAAHHTIPGHDGIVVGDHSGLQRHQCAEDLERGGRNETLLRQGGVTRQVLIGAHVVDQHGACKARGSDVAAYGLQRSDGRLGTGAVGTQKRADKQTGKKVKKRLHGTFS